MNCDPGLIILASLTQNQTIALARIALKREAGPEAAALCDMGLAERDSDGLKLTTAGMFTAKSLARVADPLRD